MSLTLQQAISLSVKLRMVARGLTRRDVADALGITTSAVTARFRDRTKWSVDDLDALCALLQVTPAELVTPPSWAQVTASESATGRYRTPVRSYGYQLAA